MQSTRSTSASRAACAASSTSVSGLNASPTCRPCSRASATTSGRFGHASWWTVTLFAPASAKPGMWRSGSSTIRWQSSTPPSRWTIGAIHLSTIGPVVTGGMKCPSPTSKWKTRHSARRSTSICSPRREKSAA